MDKIFISNLTIDALIGIYSHERTAKQILILDLELAIDAKQTAIHEDMQYTVDYEMLTNWLQKECDLQQFKLLESLAEYLCQNIIKIFKTRWVKLTITKPNAIKQTKEVGICIERST